MNMFRVKDIDELLLAQRTEDQCLVLFPVSTFETDMRH